MTSLEVSTRITFLREQKGITVNKLANLAGISQSFLREVELGRKKPTVEVLSYICEGLGITLKDFFDDELSEALKNDSLLQQIYRLTPKQRQNLLAFLKEQDGLQTVLLEKGGNFSGGQRQRLALARALLFDTPIYIFDEATSNIDMESEEMIMNVIRELSKTKMILFISHRLSNVVDSDCIYMMKDGIVAEEGTHEHLMRKKGAYQHLFDKQKELESYAANMSWNESLKKKVV